MNRIAKNRQMTVLGGFGFKRLLDYHSFINIMDGAYYVQIVEDHLILNGRKQFDQWCRLQQDKNPRRIVEKCLDKEVRQVIA